MDKTKTMSVKPGDIATGTTWRRVAEQKVVVSKGDSVTVDLDLDEGVYMITCERLEERDD